MIIVLAVLACVAAVVIILNLLPTWTPFEFAAAAADLAAGGQGMFDGLGWLNYYVPVTEMLVLLSFQVVLWGTVRLVQFGLWLLQLFHIAGGGD